MAVKIDIYRGEVKIVSVYADRNNNEFKTKHLKKQEVLINDFIVCEDERFTIKDLVFNSDCIILT